MSSVLRLFGFDAVAGGRVVAREARSRTRSAWLRGIFTMQRFKVDWMFRPQGPAILALQAHLKPMLVGRA